MKKLFILFATYLLSLIFYTSKADTWTQKASFAGSNRVGPFSFSIGNFGYIGCGYDTSWSVSQSFWGYDATSNSWTQKADFAGPPRIYATGFAISGMGYAGTGVSPGGGWYPDFWKYDPVANTWTGIADFGGGPRSEACSFVVNNKAYVGTGTGSVAPYTFNDLWEYDPQTNIWTAKTSLPSQERIRAVGFATGTHGYITCGYLGSNYFTELWQYNPVTDAWAQKANYIGDPRGGAAAFELYNQLYIGTGFCHPLAGAPYPSKDLLMYNQTTNLWVQKNSFFGTARYETGFFAVNNKGYIGIGVNQNVQYQDFWEYTPDIPTDVNELQASGLEFSVSPNPAKDLLVIETPNANMDITIRDVQGRIIYSHQPETRNPKSEIIINVSLFPQGIYFVELSDGIEQQVKKFVKE